MSNYSADDVRDFLVDNRELLNDHLEHYGLPRRSGRYKWGSGKDPYQSLGRRASLKKSAAAGERFIKSKLSSKKVKASTSRVQRKMEKRQEKEETKAAAKAKKKEKYRNEKAYVKTLSDDELRRINNRDAMENQYLKNHPQKKTVTQKMVDMAFKDILIPAVSETMKDQGKQYVKKQLKELQSMLSEDAKKKKK